MSCQVPADMPHAIINQNRPVYESHTDRIPYTTMHHSEQRMSTFLFWMVHYGIWDRCIVVFGIRSIDLASRMFKYQACVGPVLVSHGMFTGIHRKTSSILILLGCECTWGMCMIHVSYLSVTRVRLKWLALKTWGCFTNVLRVLRNILSKSYFSWEFQAENLHVCPMPYVGHTYRVSAWNSHNNWDFWHCIFLWHYFGELPKC